MGSFGNLVVRDVEMGGWRLGLASEHGQSCVLRLELEPAR